MPFQVNQRSPEIKDLQFPPFFFFLKIVFAVRTKYGTYLIHLYFVVVLPKIQKYLLKFNNAQRRVVVMVVGSNGLYLNENLEMETS